VIRSIAPAAEIADISHLISPYAVREGATVLAASVGWFPDAVHLAVVDPGVGSSRRALVLEAGGSQLVGPDNGLLLLAAARLGGVGAAHEIANPDLGLAGRSSTFHGRDVFAPAAAHLSNGVAPAEFGPEVAIDSLVPLPAPVVERRGDHFLAEVVQADHFGNLQTSLGAAEAELLGLSPGDPMEIRVGQTVLRAVFRQSYAFGPPGEVQLVEDSHGSLAVSVNLGSAAALVPGAGPGTQVLVGREGFGGEGGAGG
jgi:S-adenosylmethionine hydrolase